MTNDERLLKIKSIPYEDWTYSSGFVVSDGGMVSTPPISPCFIYNFNKNIIKLYYLTEGNYRYYYIDINNNTLDCSYREAEDIYESLESKRVADEKEEKNKLIDNILSQL